METGLPQSGIHNWPLLSGRADSASTKLLLRLLDGRYSSGVPALSFGLVDVRDVARAHYMAGTAENPPDRCILVATHATLLEMSQTIDKLYPGKHPLPRKEVPKALIYLLSSKLGLSWRYIRRNVGIPVRYDNRRSQESLGLTYRPMEESLRDQRLQLLGDRPL